jgi:hypothetical protein
MASVVKKALATVNAPYGADLSAQQLAVSLVDPDAGRACPGPIFAFFSEISVQDQKRFIEEMGLNMQEVRRVATALSAKAGYKLALAV